MQHITDLPTEWDIWTAKVSGTEFVVAGFVEAGEEAPNGTIDTPLGYLCAVKLYGAWWPAAEVLSPALCTAIEARLNADAAEERREVVA